MWRWVGLVVAILVLLLGILFVRDKVPHKRVEACCGCVEKEGRNGDTVSKALTREYRMYLYLSSDK
jgi:hypothetical protein